jgi:hypothetical protein
MAISAALAGPALAADPAKINWKSVPARTVTLFYPGQSTYQWLRGAEHPGAQVVNTGGACLTCHKGAEQKLGDKLVKANKLEPAPVEGKNGTVPLSVQVAYDKDNAYFRFQWKTRNAYPGEAYPFLRFDGKEWKPYGNQRLAGAVRKGEQPPVYEDRLSIMIDDGSVPNFANQGCWQTCHNGMRDAPNQPSADAVKANPMLSALKKNDVRKYLPSTRSDAEASWDKGKSLDEIAKLKAAGGFLELIQWRAHRSNPVGMADEATCSSTATSMRARTCSARTWIRRRSSRGTCTTRRRPGSGRSRSTTSARSPRSWCPAAPPCPSIRKQAGKRAISCPSTSSTGSLPKGPRPTTSRRKVFGRAARGLSCGPARAT